MNGHPSKCRTAAFDVGAEFKENVCFDINTNEFSWKERINNFLVKISLWVTRHRWNSVINLCEYNKIKLLLENSMSSFCLLQGFKGHSYLSPEIKNFCLKLIEFKKKIAVLFFWTKFIATRILLYRFTNFITRCNLIDWVNKRFLQKKNHVGFTRREAF